MKHPPVLIPWFMLASSAGDAATGDARLPAQAVEKLHSLSTLALEQALGVIDQLALEATAAETLRWQREAGAQEREVSAAREGLAQALHMAESVVANYGAAQQDLDRAQSVVHAMEQASVRVLGSQLRGCG